jgi:predicted TPR repeat methyltransferase
MSKNKRYSHNRDYVVAALRTAGFTRVDADFVQLRIESGLPVRGWLISAQRQT